MKANGFKNQVVSSIAWASATRLLGQLLNWAMTLIVIRFLSPTDYGLMALVMAFTGFLQAMTSMGFANALVQAREIDEMLWRRTFGLVLGISLALALLLCLVAYPLAEFYQQPQLLPLLQAASLSFLIMAPSAISRARLDRELAFKLTSRIDLVANVASGLIVLVLAWQGFGVWSMMVGMLGGMLIASGALWRLAPFRQWPAFSLTGMREILHFGGYRTAEHILWYASTQIDVLLLGKLLGEHSLGVYVVSRTVAAIPVSKLGGIVQPIGVAAFARLQDARSLALSYLLKAIGLLSLLCFPLLFGMAAVASELVDVVMGPRWAEAAIPLAIIAIGMAARPSGLLLAPFLIALGEVRASFINTAAAILLYIVAYTIGSFWGLVGVCIAGAVAYPIQLLFLAYRIGTVTGSPALGIVAPMLRPLLCATFMFLIVFGVRAAIGPELAAAPRLVVLVLVGALAYAAAALLLCRDILGDAVSLLPDRAGAAATWLNRKLPRRA
jgi:O-antigen/teichoic acid export membrane protein